MAATDGFQLTNEEQSTYTINTLFNNLRGGVFDNQYALSTRDFIATPKTFNTMYSKQHVERIVAGLYQIALQDLITS
jgi:hypothetical protein